MTLEEFLEFRNPQGKWHPSDAYDFDVTKMNRDRSYLLGGTGSSRTQGVQVYQYPRGYKFVQDDVTIALVHDGVAYFEDPMWANKLPNSIPSSRDNSPIPIPFTRTKRVKYLSELMPKISPIAQLNEDDYPVVLQRIIVDQEPLVIRAARPPERDEGVNLAILNRDGYVVAVAQNEWGATLLSVAREYRGKGLGKIIGRLWYEHNPGFGSGGLTQEGKRNAVELWKDRVREFLAHGWYSELVRQGRMTPQRVNTILKEVGKRFRRAPAQDNTLKATGDLLVWCDGISFVLYDRAFLQEQEDRFIHGFGFLRDAHPIGTYVFRIEYERQHALLATKIILQMARDGGDRLYDGEGYHDLLEGAEAISGVERDGDYLEVTRDLVPLKQWARAEKAMRRKVDPYQEINHSLIEQAEAKWS